MRSTTHMVLSFNCRCHAPALGDQRKPFSFSVFRDANRLQIFFEGKPDEATRNTLKENGFRWSPKAGAWQRQLNDNTMWVVDRISFLRPLSGEKPSELQAKARKTQQEKPSIRAQLKAAKGGQQQKPPAKEKSQDLEV